MRDLFPGLRIFVERVRRGDQIIEADATTVLQPGDVVAISGPRAVLVDQVESVVAEVDDRGLAGYSGRAGRCASCATRTYTRQDPARTGRRAATRGIYLRKIMRNLVEIPILPGHRNPARRHPDRAGQPHACRGAGEGRRPCRPPGRGDRPEGGRGGDRRGRACRRVERHRRRHSASGLSTSGGALLAGLLLGYFRAVHPTFGSIPGPALWLLNTLGLNVFIAVVGINAAPGFVAGLQQVGISLFLWGAVATSLPMIVAVLLGHYVFKFHPAILFGVCAGVRTTTAALGMIQERRAARFPRLATACPTPSARCY